MENSRKQLKISAIILLCLALIDFISMVAELFVRDFEEIVIPDYSPETVMLVVKICFLVISFLLLLPQIYVGVRGWRVADHPTSATGHIFWAKLLFVLAVLGLIAPISNIIKTGDVGMNVWDMAVIAAKGFILFDYIKNAKAVARGI